MPVMLSGATLLYASYAIEEIEKQTLIKTVILEDEFHRDFTPQFFFVVLVYNLS